MEFWPFKDSNPAAAPPSPMTALGPARTGGPMAGRRNPMEAMRTAEANTINLLSREEASQVVQPRRPPTDSEEFLTHTNSI